VQGRLLTFAQLRDLLCDRFKCTVEYFPPGAGGTDRLGRPTPPVYAFYRETAGDGVLSSTIVVADEDAIVAPTNMRSFLARLDLRPDDLLPLT
jgi:hypothetical protein